jgi:Ca-activated chloride channel family protein
VLSGAGHLVVLRFERGTTFALLDRPAAPAAADFAGSSEPESREVIMKIKEGVPGIRSWMAVAALAWLGIPRAEGAGLLVADGGQGGVLEVKEHAIRVTINNTIAVTEVEQVFHNTERRVVEALYTFPVPARASVASFSMWINGKEMTGEVVEKARARQIYQTYKQERRDPGLLEQVDYKRFEMRIFPIAAGADQRVRLIYYQELDVDHDWATYLFPLATAGRAGLDHRAQGKFSFSLEAKSEVPIVEMKSPSHGEELVMVKHSEGYWQASLEAAGGDLERDLVIAYRLERARTGFDLLASKHGNEDGYFLLTLTAGKELEEPEKGMDYVFVLDVSGSMGNEGKLGLSRDSLAAFMTTLGQDDRFELITFNISSTALFGRLSDTSQASLGRAREFLDAQKARGGTVLRPAIEAAYRYRNPDRTLNVVILSDGMTEESEHRELLKVAAGRPGGVRLFAIGIGNEVNRPLLQEIADDTGGLAAFLSAGDDFQRQAQGFRRKLMRPAATDVKLTFEGGGVYDLSPERLPSLFHGSPLRIYGRYRKGGKVTVDVAAQVQGRPYRDSLKAELPETEEANPQLDRMWAFHRVEELMDQIRRGPESAPAVEEIVRLCEGYSIAGEYASFIVLENDAEYQRWKIARGNATRVERDRRSQLALPAQLDHLRRRAEEKVQPGFPGLPVVEVLASSGAAGNIDPLATGANPVGENGARAAVRPPAAPAESRHGPRSGDFHIPMGGAIDPVTGAAALGLAALLGLKNRRGRRRDRGEGVATGRA